MEAKVFSLENDLELTTQNLSNIKDNLVEYKVENKGLQEEMAVINQVTNNIIYTFFPADKYT